MDERTDSGKLFQREGAQELNGLFPALILTLGTDKVIPLFDLSEQYNYGLLEYSNQQQKSGQKSLQMLI